MLAKRLGRLLCSALMLAALAGGIYAAEIGEVGLAGYDWGAHLRQVVVDAPADTASHPLSQSATRDV